MKTARLILVALAALAGCDGVSTDAGAGGGDGVGGSGGSEATGSGGSVAVDGTGGSSPASCAPRTGVYILKFSKISSTGAECSAISPTGITTRADVNMDAPMKILVGLGCTEVVTGDSCNTSTTYTCENTDGTPPRVWRFDVAWSEDGTMGNGKAFYTGHYPDHGGPCDLVLKVEYTKGSLYP
jgi:hypothetical protein